jgi:hypothetical protein
MEADVFQGVIDPPSANSDTKALGENNLLI